MTHQDQTKKFVRTRNWSAVLSLVMGITSGFRAVGVFRTGYVPVWASTALLVMLVGMTAFVSARIARMENEEPDSETSVYKDTSLTSSERIAFVMWLLLAFTSWAAAGRVRAIADDFGIAVNVATRFLSSQYAGHAFAAIAFGFITLFMLTRVEDLRRVVGMASWLCLAIVIPTMLYGYFGPLLNILMSLS